MSDEDKTTTAFPRTAAVESALAPDSNEDVVRRALKSDVDSLLKEEEEEDEKMFQMRPSSSVSEATSKNQKEEKIAARRECARLAVECDSLSASLDPSPLLSLVVVRKLTSMLDTFVEDANIVRDSIRALFAIAFEIDGRKGSLPNRTIEKEEMRDGTPPISDAESPPFEDVRDLLTAIVRAMRAHPRLEDIQTRGAKLLQVLALRKEENKKTIVASGVVGVVCAALGNFSETPRALEPFVGLIYFLVYNLENLTASDLAPLVRRLIDALSAHLDESELVSSGVAALAVFCSDRSDTLRAPVAADAASLAVRLLAKHRRQGGNKHLEEVVDDALVILSATVAFAEGDDDDVLDDATLCAASDMLRLCDSESWAPARVADILAQWTRAAERRRREREKKEASVSPSSKERRPRRSTSDDAREICDDLERRLASRETQLRDAFDHIASRDETIAEMRSELGTAREALASRDATMAELRSDLGAAREALTSRDEKIAEMRSELGAVREALASRDETVAEMRSALGAAREALVSRDETVAEMRSDLRTAREELASRDETVAEMRSDLGTAREALASRGETVAEMRSELGTAREALVSRDETVAEITGGYRTLVSEMSELRASRDRAIESLASKERALTELKTKCRALVGEMSKTRAELEERLRAAVRENARLQGTTTTTVVVVEEEGGEGEEEEEEEEEKRDTAAKSKDSKVSVPARRRRRVLRRSPEGRSDDSLRRAVARVSDPDTDDDEHLEALFDAVRAITRKGGYSDGHVVDTDADVSSVETKTGTRQLSSRAFRTFLMETALLRTPASRAAYGVCLAHLRRSGVLVSSKWVGLVAFKRLVECLANTVVVAVGEGEEGHTRRRRHRRRHRIVSDRIVPRLLSRVVAIEKARSFEEEEQEADERPSEREIDKTRSKIAAIASLERDMAGATTPFLREDARLRRAFAFYASNHKEEGESVDGDAVAVVSRARLSRFLRDFRIRPGLLSSDSRVASDVAVVDASGFERVLSDVADEAFAFQSSTSRRVESLLSWLESSRGYSKVQAMSRRWK